MWGQLDQLEQQDYKVFKAMPVRLVPRALAQLERQALKATLG